MYIRLLYETILSNSPAATIIFCKWSKDSLEKLVVLGQASIDLYLSMTFVKSERDVSGKNSKIEFAIVSLSLLWTKSNPFWIAVVNFFIIGII